MLIEDIFTHLHKHHREVTPNKLEAAENTLNIPFGPHNPFGSYACKIEEAIDLAEAANFSFPSQ